MVAIGFIPVSESAACCTTVDSVGRWTLPRLGYDAVQLPVRKEPARVRLRYRLPPGARQGSSGWYLIHLHFAITIAPGTRAGHASVSAVSHDYVGVLVKFKRSARDSRIRWNMLDLIRGWVDRTTTSRVIEVKASNYLPFRGVRPGGNTFMVVLRRTGALRIDGLRVLADSGLQLSRLGPARLELAPVLSRNLYDRVTPLMSATVCATRAAARHDR